MTRLEECVQAVKLAYLSHVPIIWIVTSEKEFADSIAQRFSEEHFGEFIPGARSKLVKLSSFSASSKGTEPKISFDWVGSPNLEKVGFKSGVIELLECVVNLHQNIQIENQSGENNEFNPNLSCAIIASPFSPQAGWINNYIETIYVKPLSDDEIKQIIDSFFSSNDIQCADLSFKDQLIVNFRGVSERKILVLLNRCMVSELFDSFNNTKRNKVLSEIRSLKRQMLDGFNGLKWIPIEESSTPAAGLGALSNWLKCRKEIFTDPESKAKQGFDIPNGLLITGIPGSGKSLMAKESAKILNLPLIAMDLGDLQEGVVGKSEEHMAAALRMVDAMAPCVLWIDEIEKAFSGANSGQSDGGVMRRMFGKFLTWMQEKTSFCFVFATSNDISKLPPELFRSERFDEKFFCFMPTVDECAEIFASCVNYHNQRHRKENGKTAILFDGIFESKDYWKDFLNQSIGAKGEIKLTQDGLWFDGVMPVRKLFTGADISAFVKLLKFEILNHREASVKGPITVLEMKKTSGKVLESFMPYGETNLNDIAQCFVNLSHNRFKSASNTDNSESIVCFGDFKQETSTMVFNSKKFRDSSYNQALYRCIVGSVNSLSLKNKS